MTVKLLEMVPSEIVGAKGTVKPIGTVDISRPSCHQQAMEFIFYKQKAYRPVCLEQDIDAGENRLYLQYIGPSDKIEFRPVTHAPQPAAR